jgi:serine/threonine protein kinase
MAVSGICHLFRLSGGRTYDRSYFLLGRNDLSLFDRPKGRMKLRMDLDSISDMDCDQEGDRHLLVIKQVNTKQTKLSFSSPEERARLADLLRGVIQAPHRVSIDDFDILSELGRGSYGRVFLTRLRQTGVLYAMKSISKRFIAEFDLLQQTFLERLIVISARHPFIVRGHWAFQTDSDVHIVLDFVPGGTLLDLINRGPFTTDAVRVYAAEVVLVIGWLHGEGALHRDLKPENILIDARGHIRLADFGTVKIGAQGETMTGTAYYQPPEMLKGERYDARADWWSVGILIYEMAVGKPPYFAAASQVMEVYRGILDPAPIDLSPIEDDALRDLIGRLLDKEPEGRPGSQAEIAGHPFFAGIDWDEVYERRIRMPYEPGSLNVGTNEALYAPCDGKSACDLHFPGFSMTESIDHR